MWDTQQVFTCNTLYAKNHKQISITLSRAQSEKTRPSQIYISSMERIRRKLKEEIHFKEKFTNNQLTNNQTQSGGTIPRLLCNLWLKKNLYIQDFIKAMRLSSWKSCIIATYNLPKYCHTGDTFDRASKTCRYDEGFLKNALTIW